MTLRNGTLLKCLHNGLFISCRRADTLIRFFLLWSPDVYGEPGDAESVAKRGFELITDDLEWEEPSPVRRLKPAKKAGKAGNNKRSADGGAATDAYDDDDDPLGVTAELAKESWEVRGKTGAVLASLCLLVRCSIFFVFLLLYGFVRQGWFALFSYKTLLLHNIKGDLL